MRQPLWILNSVLFGLVVVIVFFMLFSRVTPDEREDIEPTISKVSLVKEVAITPIKKIYMEDIFGTYVKEIPRRPEGPKIERLPAPPKEIPMRVLESPDPKFLDPLDITLKGIIAVGDGTDSSAIISDNKTKRETVYTVGNLIGDAQLIRIFNNKIIFVRSNGQQEVFYLREKDAQNDPAFLNIDDWNGIVKKANPNKYIISPIMFAKRVKSLAQFIDLLGLTSAYHKGKSVGCRIGEVAKDSLGDKIGFKEGDIVLSVARVSPTTTKKRLDIYKKVVKAKEGETIAVKLQRRKKTYTLRYKLEDFRPAIHMVPVDLAAADSAHAKDEQKKMLEKKYQFAPTSQQIKDRERRNMMRRGGRPATRR